MRLALLKIWSGSWAAASWMCWWGTLCICKRPSSEVERLGLVWAFTLKENQPELLREAERFTQESPTGVHAEPGREIRYWHLPEVDWPVADRLVRVVKTVRIEHQRRVTVSEKTLIERKFKPPRPRFPSAAVGESIQKSFRPSPPTVTSNTPLSTKLRPWWC